MIQFKQNSFFMFFFELIISMRQNSGWNLKCIQSIRNEQDVVSKVKKCDERCYENTKDKKNNLLEKNDLKFFLLFLPFSFD